nr:hypothetical protein GCM10025732_21900 [Glycomyces mayteni]
MPALDLGDLLFLGAEEELLGGRLVAQLAAGELHFEESAASRSARGFGTALGWLPRAWARSAEPPISLSASGTASVTGLSSASRFLLRHHAMVLSAFPPKMRITGVLGYFVGFCTGLKHWL